jgi:hypothetical protein
MYVVGHDNHPPLCPSSDCTHSVAMLVYENTPANFTNGIMGNHWGLRDSLREDSDKANDSHLAVIGGNHQYGSNAPQRRHDDGRS